MTPIAELELDLAGSQEKVVVRLFAPEQAAWGTDWTCRFEVGKPFDYARGIHGVSSMQALVLALKALSVNLYCSDEFRSGALGIYGEFGGDLTIPAPHMILDEAPFPF